MFFLGQPVLPLRCFFFVSEVPAWDCWGTFARTRPYVKRPADWWHGWGRGNPPSKTWALGKHMVPLSSFIYMSTCVYIDVYIYIQYTQLYMYIHRIQEDNVILFQISLKTTSGAKQTLKAVKRNVAAIEYIPSDLRHNGTWAWGYSIHRDEGQG